MLHLFYFTFKLIQNIAFLNLTCTKTLFTKEKYISYDVFSYTIYIYIYINIYKLVFLLQENCRFKRYMLCEISSTQLINISRSSCCILTNIYL